MSLRLSVRRWALAVAVLAAGVLASAASASAATSPLVWGSPVPYQTIDTTDGTATLFLSIACPSNGNCVAAGYNGSIEGIGTETPAFAVESGGIWAPATPITQLPSDASTSATANASLNSVSCSSATSCIAVGSYTNSTNDTDAMVVPITISGGIGSAGAATEVTLPTSPDSQTATLDGVSCGAAGCEAVGEYVDGSGDIQPMLAAPGVGGTWSATDVTAPALASEGSSLASVSCPSSGGACEAVGSYTNSDGNAYPWAVQVNDGIAGVAEPVTFPSDFAPVPPTPGLGSVSIGLTEVSCPSAGACTAVGSYPTAGVVPVSGGPPCRSPRAFQVPRST